MKNGSLLFFILTIGIYGFVFRGDSTAQDAEQTAEPPASSPTLTATPPEIPTATSTSTLAETPTSTSTLTETPTSTLTETAAPTVTVEITVETTPEPIVTLFPTETPTASATAVITLTETPTAEETVTLTPTDTATASPTATAERLLIAVQGAAHYQYRQPNDAGIRVSILDVNRVLLILTTTDEAGNYAAFIPADEAYWLLVEAPLHRRFATLVQPGEALPVVVLAGGDLNQDGCVGLSDITLLTGQFDLPNSPQSDINGDGVTEASDLAILAGNFDTTCETPPVAVPTAEATIETTPEATADQSPTAEVTLEVTAAPPVPTVTPEPTQPAEVTPEPEVTMPPEATAVMGG